MRPRTAALLVLATLLVAPLALPAAGSPQPRPVCPVCGTALAETVDDELLSSVGVRPLNLSVTGSEADVDVRSDGTAEWTVRNRLADPEAARYLREHSDRRHDVVAAALDSDYPGRPAPASVTDVRTRVDGRTLVVEFRHAGFAERRPGGVVFSDYFYTADDGFWFRLTVDRLTVRPPDGHVLTNRPEGSSADAYEVTWTGEEYPTSVRDAYLAMAPRGSAGANLATRAAIAGATLPFLVSDLQHALPGVVLFGALVWALGRGTLVPGRVDDAAARVGRERLARALVVVGLGFVFHPLLAPVVPVLAGLNLPLLAVGLVYVAAGGLAMWPGALADPDAATARLLALPAGVVAVAAAGRYLVSTPVGTSVLAALGRHGQQFAPALPAGLLLAYGFALRRGASPARWAGGAAAVLLVLALWWSNPFRPPGTFAGVVTVLLLGGAVLAVAAGYPLFLLGRLVAGDREGEAAARGPDG